MKKKYIVANWKMNPLEFREAEDLFNFIKARAPKFKNVEVIICPPSIYLGELTEMYSGNKIKFGAQDCFWEKKGPFTGEISPEMLSDFGVEYVILGHSERRRLGETNSIVNAKVKNVLSSGLKVILCVGEVERMEDGSHLNFIKEELQESLEGITRHDLANTIISYEPIWAISDGNKIKATVSPRELHQMKLFILKILKDMYDEDGMRAIIIYGGSSSPENAQEFIEDGEVAGLLVGGQSLIAENFLEMIKIADSI